MSSLGSIASSLLNLGSFGDQSSVCKFAIGASTLAKRLPFQASSSAIAFRVVMFGTLASKDSAWRFISAVCLSISSRRAFPGLNRGTRFSGMATLSPLRGLRPIRDCLRLMEKLPKPRISIRCPRTKASFHRFKDGVYGGFGIAMRELRKSGGQFFNEIGAGHAESMKGNLKIFSQVSPIGWPCDRIEPQIGLNFSLDRGTSQLLSVKYSTKQKT